MRMRVEDVLRLVTRSADMWDFDATPACWFSLMENKAADPGFWTMLDDIAERGIEEPIYITRNGVIGNGHHRLVAAILLCLPFIDVEHQHVDENDRVSAWDDLDMENPQFTFS